MYKQSNKNQSKVIQQYIKLDLVLDKVDKKLM